ncbi:MAG: hypothetical protein FD126_1769 [Elusimicrobia bacterium]|nr:MAG: hypothetical protein FD126_1769 [Elusimicrobiota bacterium]
MKRPAVLLVTALLASSCGKPAESPVAAPLVGQPSSADAGWKTFEDDWFKVSYPPGSAVTTTEDGKQNPASPVLAVIPPDASNGLAGAFTLQFEKVYTGMLLRDAIQSALGKKMNSRGTMLLAPREIKVVNGRCMTTMVVNPQEHCPKDSGNCFYPTVLTLCDDQAGRRFTAMTMLATGNNPGALSQKAQQEAAAYERILRSLEFKKS